MKIKKIAIKNFRSIKDMEVECENFTSFIGQNGAGKSNILKALNVFFDEESVNTNDHIDWYNRDITVPIIITLTFGDLSDAEVKEFEHYFRDESLIVTAEVLHGVQTKYYGHRLVIEDFTEYFDKKDEKGIFVPDLREIYQRIRKEFDDLPNEQSKERMTKALRDYEESRPTEEKILKRSDDNFYGQTKAGMLNKFIDYIYVPAVRDMTSETEGNRDSALRKLLAHVAFGSGLEKDINDLSVKRNEDIRKIIDEHEAELGSVNSILLDEFKRWANPDVSVSLSREPDPSPVKMPAIISKIEEGDFSGKIDSFGHGLHRSYLFALLNTLVRVRSEGNQDNATESVEDIHNTLIFSVEEPEIYQHPFQIRNLSNTLRKLSDGERFQSLLTTHSPLLLQPDKPATIRRVEKGENGSQVMPMNDKCIDWDSKKIPRDLYKFLNENLAEMLFADSAVLVEGVSDVAYIQTYWFKKTGELLPIPVFPVDGKGELPKAIKFARSFGVKVFVVFDADEKGMQNSDNSNIAELMSIEESDKLGEKMILGDNYVVWRKGIEDALYSQEGGFGNEVEKKPFSVVEHLNKVMDEGSVSESMEALCSKLEAFAQKNNVQ